MRLALVLLLGLAAPAAAAGPGLLCYHVRTRGAPPVVRGLRLTDRWTTGQFDLRAPLELCVAAGGTGSGAMLGYRAVRTGGARAPGRPTPTEVTSALGRVTGAAGRVTAALVSTAGGGPLLCHALHGRTGAPLGGGGPARICVAAARDGDESTNPAAPLLCYHVSARRRPRHAPVPAVPGITDVTGEAALCVPAEVGD